WDSVVVVVEGQDKSVWSTDLVAKTRVQLGSKGNGPGEYQSPGSPLKIHTDSVALIFGTAYNSFPIISVKTGRGRTYRIPSSDSSRSSDAILSSIGWPFLDYVDTPGNLYGTLVIFAPLRDPKNGRGVAFSTRMLDTVPIVRVSIVSGKTDTITQFPRGVLQGEVKRDANGRAIQSQMGVGLYGPYNGWAVMADGRVLIADGAGYKLNIMDASGASISKWVLASNPVSVSENGWDSYVEKATNGATIASQKMQNETFAKLGVTPPKQPTNRYVVPAKPAVLPPLQFGETGRGMHVVGNVAWVPVNRVDPPTRSHWDLVDLTTGKRIETIVLPDKQYVRGVTNLGVYTYAQDEDDLYRIILYRRRPPNTASATAKKIQ
ncbi:MAG: hypothetical protein ABI852_20145, partial [Gemmatimonadaceae bacterium]